MISNRILLLCCQLLQCYYSYFFSVGLRSHISIVPNRRKAVVDGHNHCLLLSQFPTLQHATKTLQSIGTWTNTSTSKRPIKLAFISPRAVKRFPSKSQPTWNHLVTLLQRPKQSVFWEGCGNKTVTKWSGLSGRSASWKHDCGNTLTFRSFWGWAHLLTSVAGDLQPALPPPPLTWLPNRLTRS